MLIYLNATGLHFVNQLLRPHYLVNRAYPPFNVETIMRLDNWIGENFGPIQLTSTAIFGQNLTLFVVEFFFDNCKKIYVKSTNVDLILTI